MCKPFEHKPDIGQTSSQTPSRLSLIRHQLSPPELELSHQLIVITSQSGPVESSVIMNRSGCLRALPTDIGVFLSE